MCRYFFLSLLWLAPIQLAARGGGADDRLPIPPAKVLAKAAALVHELYKPDIDKAAKDVAAQSLLATTLLQEAKETVDYPAGQYVLYVQARKLAAQAGNAPIALQATEELAQTFAIPREEVFAMKVAAVKDTISGADSPEDYGAIVDASLLLLEDALAEDEYAAARQLLAAADAAALKLKCVPLVSSIRRRQEQIARLEREYSRWKPYADTLRENPKDAEASLVLGKYQSFYKGDWEKGLPLLAQGKDPMLARLAALDLQRPAQAAAQVELADGWMKSATGLSDEERAQALLRAYFWYVQSLADAKQSARSQVMISTINKLLPAEYRLGDINTELRLLAGRHGPVYAVAVSPDGRRAVSGGADFVLHLWDMKTGKELRRLPGHTGRVWTAAFSPDGRRIASAGYDKTIRIWDPASGRELRQLVGHTDYIRSVAFSPDGRQLISGGDDRTIRVWSIDSGKEILKLPGHEHFVWSVAISPAGDHALSGGLDKTLRLWDLKTGKEMARMEGHRDTVLAVAFSPDGRRALSGSTDKTLMLWDLHKAESLRNLVGHMGYVHDVAFSPDGSRAVSASADGTVRLWEVYSGEELRQLDAHRNAVWSVAFSRDGRIVLSAGDDGTVRVWGTR